MPRVAIEVPVSDPLRPNAVLTAIRVWKDGMVARLFGDPPGEWYVVVTHSLWREERITLVVGEHHQDGFRRICREAESR